MEAMSAARPLFTRKRKSIRDLAMSHKCRSGHDVASFDYFVGQLLKRASEVIKSRLFVVKVSGTTMRPASGSLANFRSASETSSTLRTWTVAGSTANDVEAASIESM